MGFVISANYIIFASRSRGEVRKCCKWPPQPYFNALTTTRVFSAVPHCNLAVPRLPIAAAEIGRPADWLTPAGDLRTLPATSEDDLRRSGRDGFVAARLVKTGSPGSAAAQHFSASTHARAPSSPSR